MAPVHKTTWPLFTKPHGPCSLNHMAPTLQDPEKLQGGGYYLDRQPQSKHLPLAGTQYTDKQVDALWTKLSEMGGLPTEQA